MTTTYEMAFGINLLSPGGVQDVVSFHLRKAAILAAPHNPRPTMSHDLALVREGLLKGPPFEKQSLGQLIISICVLSRSVCRADRGADIVATALLAQNLKIWDVSNLEEAVHLGIYMSKTAKKTQADVYFWSSTTVSPLVPALLHKGFGWRLSYAREVCKHCCLATAWKYYFNMVRLVIIQHFPMIELAGRQVYAEHSLVYAKTTLDGRLKPRFLSAQRVANLIKDFHLAHIGALPTTKGYVTYWWRHFSLSALHALGEQ